MLDPNFPNRLLKSGFQRTMEFIHFLFKDYSKCDLTEKTDRSVAISGLEARIAGALKCQSRYGIFQKYFHRNLLWQISDNKIERIVHKNWNVPSWSWMAYNGGIQFIDIPFGTVDWINNLRFDEGRELALITDVGEFQDCTIKPDGKYCAILDFSRTKRGWIQYDVKEDEDLFKERCVVAGKKSSKDKDKIEDGDRLDVKEYYILVVRPTSVDGEYKRVGVGLIQSNYVVRQRFNVRVI